MYAQLGDIQFDGLTGFSSYTLSGEEALPEHKLINARPRLGHTGSELRKLSLSMSFHAAFCVPEDNISALWEAKESAFIMPLVLGNGRIIGDFVIKSISETVGQSDAVGNYIQASLNVELIESFNKDRALSEQQTAQAEAIGLQENNPLAIRGEANLYDTANGGMSKDVTNVISEGAETDKLVNQAASRPDLIDFNSIQITKALEAVGGSLGRIDLVLNGNANVLALVPGLPAEVISVATAATNLKAAMPITNINSVMNLNGILQASIKQFSLTASPASAASITRRL